MPEEIKPVNQKGYITPIVPDYTSSVRTSNGAPLDAYDLMSQRLAAVPDESHFTNVSANVLPGTGRYDKIFPGENMEEIYAQGQSWGSKMVNGVGKGLSLTGTTLLQSTVGLVNGLVQWEQDGRAASFYDNEFNRNLDEFNKKLEDTLPNYYTTAEKDANWYSPKKLFTANFLWDGIVKNLGFSAGAYLSGGLYTAALKALPLTSRLFSIGKAAETLAATEEGLLAANKAAETYGKIKGLSDKFVSSYKSLNTGGRALVAGLSTTGEAGFEAYNNLNQFRDEKIREFREANGGMSPIGDDLEKINQQADNVGNSSFIFNTALLTATNYIQFPKILGSSYKAEKGIVNGLTKEIEDLGTDAAGNLIRKAAPKTRFGKIISSVNKVRPYLFSTSEGFEEGAQYAIQVGTQDYYNKKYKGEDSNFADSLIEGVVKTFTTNEGMENVLIGGLSGAMTMARGTYQEKKEKKLNTENAIKEINKTKLSDFTKETFGAVNRGIILQEEREELLKQGDVLESKDKETDYIINYLTPRIKYGRTDLVTTDLQNLRDLASSDEGFGQLVSEGKALEGDTREAFIKRLDNLETTTQNVKSLYQSLNLRYGNIMTKDGKPAYTSSVMDQMIYAATKVSDYDKRIPEIGVNLTSQGIDFTSAINGLAKDDPDAYNAAMNAIEGLDIVSDRKDELMESLQDIGELSLRRQRFLKEYDDIKKNPQNYSDVTNATPTSVTPDVSADGKDVIKIKTKDGEETIALNEDYVAGAKEIQTQEGITLAKFLEFKVIGKADNGDIVIQTKDGKTHSIKPSAFEEYKLGKSATLSRTSRFYLDNYDKKFNFKLKGGKSIEGQIIFDPKTKSLYFESTEKRKNSKPVHRIAVTLDQFETKTGFKTAQIWSNTKFSPKTEALFTEAKSQEEVDVESNIEAKLNERRRLIKEIADETREKISSIDEKIVAKREELAKLNEELGALGEFRVKDKYSNVSIVTNFNKILSRSMQGLTKLTGLKNSFEREIEELQAQKESLEFNVEYFDDFIANVKELPEDFRDMLDELRDQRDGLSSLVLSTGIQINQFSKMIDTINDAIKDLASLLQSTFQKFDKDYPDYIKKNFEEMKDNPLYEKVKELKEYIADYALMEDTKKEVSVSEDKIKEIIAKIDELYKQLTETGKELDVKEQIIKKFEETLKKYEQKVAEEAVMKKSEEVMKQVLGTMNQGVQNAEFDREYQADDRKASDVVGKATTYPSAKSFKESGETPSEHHQRVNRFGSRLNSLDNQGEIKGVVVTNSLQGAIVPGLTEFLAQDKAGIDPTQTIAIVMATVNDDDTYTLVDEFGKPIAGKAADESAEDYAKRLHSSAIFQTFPTVGKLDGMFREGTSQDMIDGIKEEYAIWRTTTLEAKQLTNYNITASFGRPQNVQENKANGQEGTKDNYNARIGVEDSGLVTDDELLTRQVIKVPTTEERVSKGSTSFGNALGRVFLMLKNALQPLNNRNHTAKEANTIFDAMSALAETIYQENKKGKFKFEDSPKAQRLVDWLRTVVYWGTPREGKAGYNSVFFEKTEDGLKLFMSGKQNEEGKYTPVCDFTSSSLADNKAVIINTLQKMYNNTNNRLTDETYYNDRYEQILAVSPEGEVTESVIWPNYQSYLLSSKSPDASGKLTIKRKAEDIPLTTRVRPLANEEDTNRDDIYFIIDNTDIDKRFTDITAKDAQAVSVTAQKKTAPETKTVTTVQKKFTADGFTENTVKMKAGDVVFTIDESDPEGTIKIKSVAPEIYTAAFKNAEAAGKETSNEIINQTIAAYIIKQVKEDIANPPTVTEQVVVTPAAPAVEEILGKFDLDGITKNTTTIGGSEVIFTLDKNDPEGTVKLVSVNEALMQKLLATQPDRNIVLQTIAARVVQEAKKDIAEVQQSKQVAFEKATQTPKAEVPTATETPVTPISTAAEVKPKVLLSGLNEGFKGVSYESFDVRAVPEVMSEINNQSSFAKTIDYKGKKYVVVGLRLETARPESTSGRNNYSFAVAELNNTTPKNIVEILENEAKENFKNIYNDFNSKDVIRPITTKDAELKSLEEGKPAEPVEVPTTVQGKLDNAWNNASGAPVDPNLRQILAEQVGKFEGENWKKLESYIKKRLPNVPIYRVKNVLKGTNGVQAYGMFKDGAIYIYTNAEVGTGYHEIFHAVYQIFADANEREGVQKEFRARPGSFTDRVTGQDIKYSEATDREMEEQLAEEFRDYVLYGKVPMKPKDTRPFIVKLFSDLKNFIKELFVGPNAKSNTEILFEKIDKGYYKTFIPQESSLSYAKAGIIDIDGQFITSEANLSEIPGLSGGQVHDLMQEMTYLTFGFIARDTDDLFNISKINRSDIYAKIQNNLIKTIKGLSDRAVDANTRGEITDEDAKMKSTNARYLFDNVLLNWDELIKTHEQYLKKYDVEFDENDAIGFKDENKTGKGEYDESHKIDYFRKLNSAVKLALSTLPMLDNKGNPIESSIGGRLLVPTGEAYMAVMNNAHDATNIDDLIERIRKMAKDNNNYEMLYKRLTKVSSSDDIIWENLKKSDVTLLGAFDVAFNKQNPDVKIFNILPSGDIQIGEANLTTAARQIKQTFLDGMKIVFNNPKNPYFKFDKPKNAYISKTDDKGVSVAANYAIGTIDEKVRFLDSLGISFNASDIKSLERKNGILFSKFNEAVGGIKKSLVDGDSIANISGKALKIEGRILTLAGIKARMENPEFSSTYFGVNGERIQTFIGSNPSSNLFKNLAKITKFEQLANNPNYRYLYTDSFSKHSVILDAIFNIKEADNGARTGNRKDVAEGREFLKPSIANGMNNQVKSKKKESSKLNFKERLVQEINMNLDGYYYNLVAGDASLEYMTYMGNHIKNSDMRTGYGQIHTIFRGYLIDEINLARENRAVAKGRTSYELRFMKAILGQELTSEILEDKTSSPESIYEKKKNKIDKAVEKFIEKNTQTFADELSRYGVISPSLNEGKMIVDGLGFAESEEEMSMDNLNLNLKTIIANYIINNIEFHKLLYSDPYQYSDELKRIKNFLSPRQAIISGSAAMNSAFNRVWNEGFKEGDLGWTNFNQDFFKSTTLEDVTGVIDLERYDDWEEADGGGMISMKAYRNFRIRASNWSDAEEAQYRHDVEYEKLARAKATEEELENFDKKNPGVRSAYTPIKPIVAGAKLDNNGKPSDVNNPMLDKFALYPLSYRIIKQLAINGTKKGEAVKELNALKLYDKMQAEKLDYVVFKSARKVGAKELNSLYNTDGSFNTNPYKGQINVPFSIMSVQSEVPSKEDELVTRGSQVTKLMTVDFMVAGIPIDYLGDNELDSKIYETWNQMSKAEKEKASPIYKEIMKNQELLEKMTKEGYQTLLKKLGIEEQNGKFVITEEGKTKAVQTLRDEILKREVNSNILSALDGYSKGDAVLEATPAYQQIRNILYSLVDKNIVSPKIRGGLKVQIPSTLLESVKAEQKTINGKTGFTSDVLEFYSKTKDGKKINVCEIMVGRWFKSDMSDQDLLKYLNDTEEGQKILSGLAFRIPTQKQNSIDVFKIKQFLPKEFGDSVVIPSALVKKVGSDFDIDKLSIYLKNVFTNPKGELKMVPFFGYGEQAKDKFRKMFDDGELLTPKQAKELDRIIEEQRDELFAPIYDEEGNMIETSERKLFRDLFGEMFSDEKISEDFIKGINRNGIKEALVDKLYKESLENEYIQSSQNLVSHPLNFSQLTKPNSSKDLENLSKDITKKIGGKTFDYTEVGNMLDRTFMSALRHAFVTGKYAIGIAAVAQTNHAQNQRTSIFIDLNRLNKVSKEDRAWLKDGKIKFKQFNRMKMGNEIVASLSMAKNKAGEYISDIIGMFIDGYVDIAKGPWIMQLGATPNVASTWLFLVKIGVPIKSVAYFMNQPIIRDYLQSVENAGYSYLFMDSFVEATKNKYKTTKDQLDKVSEIPGETKLYETLGATEFTPTQNAEQQFILDEFLKYAKMSEQLLHVTQGTNWDTATLNDPLLVFKKNEQLKKSNNTIISSADDILKNSFIGKLRTFLNNARNAVAEILSSDKTTVRNVMEEVLRPYVDMPDADFLKIARKAVSDFYDWAVQIDSTRNQTIKELLLSNDNAPKQVLAFKNEIAKDTKHPLYNNYIIGNKGILETKPADREGGVNNLSIKNKDNKVYDQDQIIFAFREIREYLKSIDKLDLYENIVGVSVLQSGLSTTPYSFTSLLPYEDFKDVYNNILFKIEARDNIMDFYKLGIFQRANATNDDVVAQERAKVIGGKYNRGMDFGGAIQTAIKEGKMPQLLKLSSLSQAGDSEYVSYSWDKSISKEEKNRMRQNNDYSFINKALFQKVYYDDAKKFPVIDRYINKKTGKVYDSFVYKMVNSWGDGFRANEFYGKIQASVIDNGFTKVQEGKSTNEYIFGNQVFTEETKTSGEKPDSAVNQYFSKVLPVVSEEKGVSSQPIAGDEVSMRNKAAELEQKKKTKGLGPVEMATLAYLENELGKIKHSNC